MLLMTLALLSSGCQPDAVVEEEANKKTNRVVAVSYPLQYVSQRIAGEEIEVQFLTPEGQDPIKWRPPTESVLEMQDADLIVTNGAGAHYATWLTHFTLPESKICQSTADLPLADYMKIDDHQIVHSHGPEGEHSHSYMVPYTWLDPNVLSRQADMIHASLTEVYPERTDEFAANLTALKADLAKVAAQASQIAAEQKDDPGYAIHLNPNTRFCTRAAGFRDDHLLYFDAESDVPENLKRFKDLFIKSKPRFLIVDREDVPEELTSIAKSNGIPVLRLQRIDHPVSGGGGDCLKAIAENFRLLNGE